MTPTPKLAALAAAFLLPAACAGSGSVPDIFGLSPAGFTCDGTTLFEGVQTAWQEAEADPASEMLRDRARARAIYFWGYAGIANLSGWSKSGSMALATCYREGACGLPVSEEAADALETSAERIYANDTQPVPDGVISEIPPESAWSWARARADWDGQDCSYGPG